MKSAQYPSWDALRLSVRKAPSVIQADGVAPAETYSRLKAKHPGRTTDFRVLRRRLFPGSGIPAGVLKRVARSPQMKRGGRSRPVVNA
jgi:hypothetical protein